VIESKAFSPEHEGPDRLALAIRAFREDVLLWIDTELARLRQWDPVGTPPAADSVARASASGFGVRQPREGSPLGPLIETEPSVPVSNPRQRLDALARMLDDRLRQAEADTGPRRGTASENQADTRTDAPLPPRREDRG
jgi:hypothetical protein